MSNRDLSVKNKLIKPEENFFKNNRNKQKANTNENEVKIYK